MSRPRILLALLLITFCVADSARALTANEVAIVVNRNVAASVKLGAYYARVRKIPPGQIIQLDLPAGEEITFDRYERDVVLPIREFLRKNRLENKIQCLVTFYGVPFRIASRVATPADARESAELKQELSRTLALITPQVQTLEKSAREVNEDFLPHSGTDLEALSRRADEAARAISVRLGSIRDADRRQALIGVLFDAMQKFAGPIGLVQRFEVSPAPVSTPASTHPTTLATTAESSAQRWSAMRQEAEVTLRAITAAQDRRFDPAARAQARQLVRENLGLFNYARLLEGQIMYVGENDTLAAVDNELSLLWWNYYPRYRWMENPRYWRLRGVVKTQPTLMVMRLDGPQEGTARDIILTSMKAEAEGLKGCVAIDRGGAQFIDPSGKKEGYLAYEQTLINLAHIIQTKTKLTLVQDLKPSVFPPHSVNDVALYVGWYRLRDYVPGMNFRPGAVGYHVASLEMVGLHSERETGWVHGLLSDGIAATLGAVAEPYLHSFPAADDFFPLLLTGKLTLAEVYWDTEPLTSWMICMIGDPLYTPYKKNPQLKVQDLPDRLQVLFEKTPEAAQCAATRATTRPMLPPATMPTSAPQ